jgi:hypothetical protein
MFKIGDMVVFKTSNYLPEEYKFNTSYKVLEVGVLSGAQYITIDPKNKKTYNSWSQYSKYFEHAFDPNSVEIEDFL